MAGGIRSVHSEAKTSRKEPPLILPCDMSAQMEIRSETIDARDDGETTPTVTPIIQADSSLILSNYGIGNFKEVGDASRRSSLNPVHVQHHSDDPLPCSQTTVRTKERQSSSNVTSQVLGKRHRESSSETSGGEGTTEGESTSKRVCQREPAMSEGASGGAERNVIINPEPLELVAKFKAEREAFNEEENKVVQ